MKKSADSATAPIKKSVTVPLSRQEAFARFTERIDTWWPRATHSVGHENVKRIVLEVRVGGRLYEECNDGEISVWGTVTALEAPDRIAFTWHPGREADTAQRVEVRFHEKRGTTTVELTHTGWDKLGDDAASTRANYDKGWDGVLDLYTTNAGRTG